MFRRIIATAAILLLGGCAATAQPISQESLAKAAFSAKAAYAGALIVAAPIVALPRCERFPAPCVYQSTVNTIRKLDLAADAATQAAEDAVRSLDGDTTLMKLVVDNAANAVKAFKTIVDKGGK